MKKLSKNMEVLIQLRSELKEAIKKRKTLASEMKRMNFYIDVFEKEVSLRES